MAYTNTIGILIAAKDEASAVIRKAAAETNAATGEVNSLGGAAGIAGGLFKGALVAGLIATAAESANLAIKFQQHMMMLHTNAGVAKDQIDGLSQAILNMSASVGQGPDQLAQAFYHIASAGTGIWSTAQQLDILKVAAQGADVGIASLDDTTYALTSAMSSGIGGVKNATEMMGALTAIVGAGDMKLQDLNGALSTGILSTAKVFGISIQSLGTALATLTDNGEHADEAATRLRMSFALMASPSGAATKQLEALGLTAENAKVSTEGMNAVFAKSGLSTTKLADDLRQPNGITVAMKDLQKHLEDAGLSASEADAMLSKAFGGGRTDAALLTMLTNIDRMDEKFKAINKTSSNFAQNFKDTQTTAAYQIKAAWDGVQAGLVRVGEFMGQVANVAAKYLAPVFQEIGDLWNKYIQPSFDRVIGANGDKIILFFGVLLVGAITAIVAPLVLLGTFLSATIVAFDYVSQAIERAVGWLQKAIPDAINNVKKKWDELRDEIAKVWTDIEKTVTTTVGNIVKGVAKEFRDLPSQIAKAITDTWHNVSKAISDGWNTVVKDAPSWGKAAADAYINGLKALAGYDLQSVMQWGKGIADAYNVGAQFVAQLSKGISDALAAVGPDLSKWGQDTGKRIHDGFDTAIKNAVKWGQDAVANIGKGIKGGWNDAVKWGQDTVANIGKGVTSAVTNGIKWGQDTIANIVKGLLDGVGSISKFFTDLPNLIGRALADSGKQAAEKHLSGMKSNFVDVGKMKDLGNAILQGLLIAIGAIVGGILLVAASIVIALINGMIAGWQKEIKVFADTIVNSWNWIGNAFASWGNNMVNWARGAVAGIVREFVSLPGQIGKVIGDAFSGAANNVHNALHNAHIPGFATGGFTGQGSATEIAGVVHKGEYVVPKDQVDQTTGRPKMMGSGGGNIYVTNNNYTQLDYDKGIKDLGFMLRRKAAA